MLPYSETIILLPTYNEIENIEKMLAAITGLDQNISVLVIDDNSPDGTALKVKEIQKNNSNIHLLQRSEKNGLGQAYLAGFQWALEKNYNYVFEIDCDFSHDPNEIPNMLKEVSQNNYHLAIGSRYIGGIRIINWPIHRLLLSYFASIYTQIITGMPIKDPTGGFKCFSRKALESLNFKKIMCNGYSFQIELNFKIWSQGLKIKEHPITFYERRIGQSKMNKSIVIEAVFAVFKLRIKKILGTL